MRYSNHALKAISGTVPSPLEWPTGCRFAPRCDYTFDKCITHDPPLLPVPPQESACWLCENGRRVPRVRQVVA
jgi:peptide/nickel transport system ATP-binding protein